MPAMLHPQVLTDHPSGAPLVKTLITARRAAFFEGAGAAAANFAISIFIARTYDAATFSGYITALSAAFVAIAFLRFSFVTPTAVKSDVWYNIRLQQLVAVHVLASLGALIVASLVLFVIAAVLQTPLSFFAALSAPGVCLWFVGSEFERSFLLKQKRYGRLMIISVVQAAMLLVVFLAVWAFKLPFGFLIIAITVLGAARSFAAISVVGRPAWRKGFRHLRVGLREMAGGATAYLLGSVACSHAPVFVLSIFARPEQAAAFAAMRTLYQPAQIFFRSRDVVVQTGFHRDRSLGTSPVFKQFLHGLGTTALLSIIFSACFIVIGPWLIHLVYAGRYDDHLVTFWLWAAIMLLINLAAITDAFISFTQQQNRYAKVQISAGLICIAFSMFLVSRFGDEGAAISALGGWFVIVAGGAYLMRTHVPDKRV